MKILRFLAAFVGLWAGSLSSNLNAAISDAIWDDFEQGSTFWKANGAGNLVVADYGLSPDFPSEGKNCFRIRFESAVKSGRIVLVNTQVSGLVGAQAFKMDVYNSSKVPLKFYLVFKQGERYTWYESEKVDVKSGWNRDLTVWLAPTGAPAGVASMKIADLKDIREGGLYFEALEPGDGILYLDNLRLPGADPAQVLKPKPEDVVSGTEVLLTGFEAACPFTPDSAWSSATGAESVAVNTTQGVRAGKFEYDAKSPDDKGSFTFEGNIDLTPVNGIRFDVYNPLPDDADAEIAITTGAQWVFHESTMKTLKPGWNRDVSFSVKTSTFKSANSGWKNTAVVQELNQTRKISLFLFPHTIGQGFFVVDNIRFTTADVPALQKMLSRVIPPDVPLTGKDTLVEGFERDPVKFTADTGSSAAVAVAPVTVKTTEGSRLLKCDFDNPGDKSSLYALEMNLDLSKAQAVKVDVFLPEAMPLQTFLALNTGASYEWWESKSQGLKKGWNRDVTFLLTAPIFKAQATGWQLSGIPKNLKMTKKLYIGFFSNKAMKGSVFMDNVRVTGPVAGDFKAAPARVVKGRTVVWDPMETAAYGWVPSISATDNSFATGIHYEKIEGQNSVKFKYRTQSADQSARYYKAERLDWTSVLALKMDVFNPQDHTLVMTLAFKTGSNYTYHESKDVTIKPGWNKDLTVDLSSPQMKTQRSNWSNTDYLNQKDDLREVSFNVFPKRAEEGSLTIANLRTMERDLLGALGMKEAGQKVGVSSKTVFEGRYVKYRLVESFEGSTSAWQPNGKIALSISDRFVSDSHHSLKAEYDVTTNDDPEIVWKPLAAGTDLTPYSRMQFDVYNAGPPVRVSLAFATGSSVWVESATVSLAPGWNRNVSFNFTGNAFKSARTAWVMGENFRNQSLVDTIHLKIDAPPGRGDLYFDRIQLGSEDETLQTDYTSQQTVLMKVNPFDAAQLKVEGDVKATDSGPAIGQVSKAKIDLRGLGNEFSVSTGEALTGTDDPLQLLDGATLGSNIFGLSERFQVLNTTIQATGFSRYGEKPHTFGTSSGYALRLKQTYFENYQLGAGLVTHRYGSEPGANPLNAEVEADVKTVETDLTGYLRPLHLSFLAEAARSFYDSWSGGSYDLSGPSRDAYKIGGNVVVGKFKFAGTRTEMQANFFAPYANSFTTAAYQHSAEISWQADTFKPIVSLKKKSPFLRDLFDGFYVFGQYYDYHHRLDTDSNWNCRLVARNYDSSRLHYFMWWYWLDEGKDAGDSTLTNPLLSTHIQTTTVNPEIRYRLTDSLFLNYLFRFSYTDYWEEITQAGGFTFQFLGDTRLYGDGKVVRKTGSRQGNYANWSMQLERRFMANTVEARVIYGVPSFVNYWNDENNLKTVNQWSFALSAKF